MKYSASASGKLILSGEYAVVFGYPGIAVPAPFMVTATWNPSPSLAPARFTLSRGERETHHHDLAIRHSGIENEDYLHRILDAITAKIGSLYGHLTIENTIPIGRGMGSSTALVITIVRAIMRKASCHTERSRSATRHPHDSSLDYARDDTPKETALSIENTVNPGHSGLDFAVIWEGKPVTFTKETGAAPINLDLSFLKNAVLIDTGKPNETTSEMVAWIKGQMGIPSPSGEGPAIRPRAHGREGRGSKKNINRPPLSNSLPLGERTKALQTIAHCTERLLTASGEACHPERSRRALYKIFRDHHRAQIALGVVPEPVQALIADIEKSGGAAKVVGAGGRTGGGGMVLALHPKPEKLLVIARHHGMPTITPV